jgi:DNA-binding NarL/FixJ family response regulator
MAKDILVAIICDDYFSRNWMSLLTVRDWRTRVVAEVDDPFQLTDLRSDNYQKIDLVLLDLDHLREPAQLFQILWQRLKKLSPAKVLCVASRTDPRTFSYIKAESFAGYLQKDEISSSLGWALSFAAEGKQVYTPSALQACFEANFSPCKPYIVLQARPIPGLTPRQSETARLAIIFSIGRRDLADELTISEQWSYGMVSELYDKLGLPDLFTSKETPYSFINEDPVIKARLDDILEQLGNSKKARDLESLAFHLITMPVIIEDRS